MPKFTFMCEQDRDDSYFEVEPATFIATFDEVCLTEIEEQFETFLRGCGFVIEYDLGDEPREGGEGDDLRVEYFARDPGGLEDAETADLALGTADAAEDEDEDETDTGLVDDTLVWWA